MAFATITTKREGTCQRCNQTVPVGTRVRYTRGKIWHYSKECPVQTATAATQQQPVNPDDVMSALGF